MTAFILWYISLTILHWLTFPLAQRLFPALPDKGFALSRTLGLLIWGYVFWLFASFGIAQNDIGGILLALAVLVGLSAWAFVNRKSEIVNFLKSNLAVILTTEILFLVAFAFMAFVRSANPELASTEKPMELAFISGIMRSPFFPPQDPWLSGYAISYYYFGYVMTAMLARLTGIPGSMAHNLMTSLVFALGAIGSFGILYNLLTKVRKDGTVSRLNNSISALLAPLFLLLVSNFGALLEVLHRYGLFWSENSTFWKWLKSMDANNLIWLPKTTVFNFWTWLDVKELSSPPVEPLGWEPERYLWWWRSSRVMQDYDMLHNPLEVIDEFPFFSFLLGDLHPHVLAIPFALLAIAVALHIFLGGWKGSPSEWTIKLNKRTWAWISLATALLALTLFGKSVNGFYKFFEPLFRETITVLDLALLVSSVVLLLLSLIAIWVSLLLASSFANVDRHGLRAFVQTDFGTEQIGLKLYISKIGFLIAALVLGGLAFLNTWDILVAATLIVLAYVFTRAREDGWSWHRLEDLFLLGLPLGILSIVLYLPFYFGFSSQAGGIYPSLMYPSRGAHLWVMWGTLLIPIYACLLYLWRGARIPANWKLGFLLGLGFVFLLWILSWLIGAIGYYVERDFVLSILAGQQMDIPTFFRATSLRRLSYIGGLITMLAVLISALAFLFAKNPQSEIDNRKSSIINHKSSIQFILMILILGAILIIAPDFVYLRDQFGYRINTVFKFYYQAWILWSLVASFGVAYVLQSLRGVGDWLFRVFIGIVIFCGLLYPSLSLLTKTNDFRPVEGYTLDDLDRIKRENPDEAAAIEWLRNAPDGVIVEAVGDGYSSYARISTYTGLKTVLGWPGHEAQWRGSFAPQGSRREDVTRLYATARWEEAQTIIDQYDIRYIYIGVLERVSTALNEEKFMAHLKPVFLQGNAVIYEVPQN